MEKPVADRKKSDVKPNTHSWVLYHWAKAVPEIIEQNVKVLVPTWWKVKGHWDLSVCEPLGFFKIVFIPIWMNEFNSTKNRLEGNV